MSTAGWGKEKGNQAGTPGKLAFSKGRGCDLGTYGNGARSASKPSWVGERGKAMIEQKPQLIDYREGRKKEQPH